MFVLMEFFEAQMSGKVVDEGLEIHDAAQLIFNNL